jgi:hypothetical protein
MGSHFDQTKPVGKWNVWRAVVHADGEEFSIVSREFEICDIELAEIPEPYFVEATIFHFLFFSLNYSNDHEVNATIFVVSRQRKHSKQRSNVASSLILGYHLRTKAQGDVPDPCQTSPERANVAPISKVTILDFGNAQKTNHRFLSSTGSYTVFRNLFDPRFHLHSNLDVLPKFVRRRHTHSQNKRCVHWI